MIAVIEQAGVPALRVGFTLAVIVFLVAGVLIFRRRHQFFDRDPLSATACFEHGYATAGCLLERNRRRHPYTLIQSVLESIRFVT
jgi:hypothetical protein